MGALGELCWFEFKLRSTVREPFPEFNPELPVPIDEAVDGFVK